MGATVRTQGIRASLDGSLMKAVPLDTIKQSVWLSMASNNREKQAAVLYPTGTTNPTVVPLFILLAILLVILPLSVMAHFRRAKKLFLSELSQTV